MHWIFAPLRLIYKIYFGVIFIITGIILYPFMLVFIKGKRKYKNGLILKKVWSKSICFLTLIRVSVKNVNNFPQDQPYIVCANHASYLDIILMFLIIPHDFAFLGKAEVLSWPIINIFFKRKVDIPVYRGSIKKAKECLDLAEKALEHGRCVAIFPEGGMDTNNPKLKRFKNGAFKLAEELNVPIVPMSLLNNWKLFSDHEDIFGAASPGIAKIEIHEPIYPSKRDGKNSVYLRNETYKIIDKSLKEYANR